MGYDLHIVRTREWAEAYKSPIQKSDVDKLVAAGRDLAWSKSDYVDMRDKMNGRTIRYWMIEWNGQSVFWWYSDQIICKNPNEPQQIKMIQMASALNAMAVGDEGERYELSRSFFGKVSIKTIAWPN